MNAAEIDSPLVFGVAGARSVVSQSLSPKMMDAAFSALGIEAWYVPLALRETAAAKALRGLSRLGFRGVNVTMPYKSLAAQIATTKSREVERCGMANVLVMGRHGVLHAETTDGAALLDAIASRGVSLRGANVLLVGAGGVATEAAFALASAGVERIGIWNRTRSRADQLLGSLQSFAPDIKLQVFDRMPIREPFSVLVGCVPADAIDPRTYDDIHVDTLVVDYAYRRSDSPTPIIASAERQSARYVEGRELLVRQGAISLQLWLDVDAPTKVMLSAIR